MELWKDISYNSNYQISNHGKVKRKERVERISPKGVVQDYTYPEQLIKPEINNSGYERTTLWRSQKSKKYFIHRLVAEHFIINLENKETVNHKDGDKLNNHHSNLEWMTNSENIKHSIETGLFIPDTSGINPPRAVHKLDKITGDIIKTYNTMTEAYDETGISHISSVCRGKRNTAGGFKWMYAE